MSGRPGHPPPPPPPPPAPTRQGGAAPFVNIGSGGPPRPELRPQGPQPPPGGFQPPSRQPFSSTRVVDLTPRRPLDEDSCRKRMTHHDAYTIRKIVPRDSNIKASWATSEITKEPLSQDDISRAMKRLNESRRSVQEKKAALMPFQQNQVNRLMDDLINGEIDGSFEWSLAQIDQKISTNKKGQKETSTLTIYVKRGPLKDLNMTGLFSAIERNKIERIALMNRPPPRPEPIKEPAAQAPRSDEPFGMKGKPKAKIPGGGNGKRLPRPKQKKYHDYSSDSSQSSNSGSESDSDYTSDSHTTISTQSDRHSKKHSRKGRSHSRTREHRRKYYVGEQILSPEPHHRSSLPLNAMPRYAPGFPRIDPNPVQAIDPVIAAYQTGKIDADAERFGLDRSPRRSIAQPTAITYGRPMEPIERFEPAPRFVEEVRYVDRLEPVRDMRHVDRLEPVREMRYVDRLEPVRDVRYVHRVDPLQDVRFDRPEPMRDVRHLDRLEDMRYVDEREDEYFRRDHDQRRRDAEDYQDRRARMEPKFIYEPNPFTPMRASRPYSYTPSNSTRDSRDYDYRR